MKLHLAGCIILDEDKKLYLLHRNKKGTTQWELPGGKIEEGEDAQRAAIREIHEELGADVEIIRELGQTQFKESDMDFDYVWFLAEVRSGALKIGEPETFDALRSFSVEQLDSLKLSSNMQKLHKSIVNGEVIL